MLKFNIIWIILKTILSKLFRIPVNRHQIIRSIINHLLGHLRTDVQSPTDQNAYEIQKLLIEQKEIMNARNYNIILYKYKQRNVRADLVTIFAMSGLISCMAVLIYFRNILTADIVLILLNLLGFCISILDQICRFEFGTTRSNKNPDDLL